MEVGDCYGFRAESLCHANHFAIMIGVIVALVFVHLLPINSCDTVRPAEDLGFVAISQRMARNDAPFLRCSDGSLDGNEDKLFSCATLHYGIVEWIAREKMERDKGIEPVVSAPGEDARIGNVLELNEAMRQSFAGLEPLVENAREVRQRGEVVQKLLAAMTIHGLPRFLNRCTV